MNNAPKFSFSSDGDKLHFLRYTMQDVEDANDYVKLWLLSHGMAVIYVPGTKVSSFYCNGYLLEVQGATTLELKAKVITGLTLLLDEGWQHE